MSSAARPQQQPPAGQLARPSSGALPPAPTSILQKQSSFSKKTKPSQPGPAKAGGGAPGAGPQQPQPQQPQPQPQRPMPTAAAAPTPVANRGPAPPVTTPQAGRPAGAPAPVAAKTPAAATRAAAGAGAPQAMAPSQGGPKAPAPPGMWGPNGELAPRGPKHPAGPGQPGPYTMAPGAPSPSTAVARGAAPLGAAPVAAGARAPAMTPSSAGGASGMARQNSFGATGGSQFGSMGPGAMSGGATGMMPSAYGSMGPGSMGQQGYGSMGPGAMGSLNQQGYGSMAGGAMTPGSMGPSGYGSMGAGAMQGGYGSMGQQGYGSMGPGAMGSMGPVGMGGYGSMGPGQMNGSMYGGSMMGGNSLFGSQFGSMGPGAMGGGAGSLYGMPGVNRATSAYGFAAQWGSLANMSAAPDRSGISRSSITSGYAGFESEAKGYRIEDLAPNIGTLEEGKPVKRSGRRGGNHLYNRGKNDKTAPVLTSNSKASTMTIKRKEDLDKAGDASRSVKPGAKASDRTTPAGTAAAANEGSKSRGIGSSSDRKPTDGKVRAKLPGNYDLHTLLVVDKAADDSGVAVKDPNTVVLEKDGKKETFETDEAILREKPSDEVDSVLLSSVLTGWHGGHNSSLLVGAGKGKAKESIQLAHDFVKGAVERLEKTASANYFDISINMVSIRGANQGCDLLKSGASYSKLQLGSSPVYGPCLLGLETKVVKSAKECVTVLEDGIAAAKEAKEIVAAFLVLKQSKKGGDKEVRLSSLCIGYVREELKHLMDIKDKASNSPYQLFRYAVGGASVCVSALVLAANDETARSSLDVERKMREVKNRAPRSGNLQKFIEYTQKEITRMKEKAASGSDADKKRSEAQIKKMEDMIGDTQKILDEPEKTAPIGYPLPS